MNDTTTLESLTKAERRAIRERSARSQRVATSLHRKGVVECPPEGRWDYQHPHWRFRVRLFPTPLGRRLRETLTRRAS